VTPAGKWLIGLVILLGYIFVSGHPCEAFCPVVFADLVRRNQEAFRIFHESWLILESSDGILGVSFGAVDSDE
jgi:hypothetical protein